MLANFTDMQRGPDGEDRRGETRRKRGRKAGWDELRDGEGMVRMVRQNLG